MTLSKGRGDGGGGGRLSSFTGPGGYFLPGFHNDEILHFIAKRTDANET